jgi:hypothetical protein
MNMLNLPDIANRLTYTAIMNFHINCFKKGYCLILKNVLLMMNIGTCGRRLLFVQACLEVLAFLTRVPIDEVK